MKLVYAISISQNTPPVPSSPLEGDARSNKHTCNSYNPHHPSALLDNFSLRSLLKNVTTSLLQIFLWQRHNAQMGLSQECDEGNQFRLYRGNAKQKHFFATG